MANLIKYDFFLALFAFLMPINEKASTIIIFFCLLALIIEFVKKKVRFKLKKELLIFPILYLIYVGTSIFLSDKIEFKLFEQKAALIIFPFLFSTTYKYNQKKILTAFVYGCIVAYVICIVIAFNNSLVFDMGNISFNPLLNESRGFGFFKSMIYEGNYFFGSYFSRLIQISYFAIYLAFAISILLFQPIEFKGKNFIIFIFVIAILQTTSLAGILNLLIIVLVGIIYRVKSRKKRAIIFFGCLGLILLSARYHPRINTTIMGVYKTLQGQNSPEFPKQPRIMTWKASIMAVGQHGIAGLGVGTSQKELNKKYVEINFQRGRNENLNAHNEYLQILLECGVIGFVALLFIFYALIKRINNVEGYKKPFVLCFLLLILVNFMLESMMNRYIGISFFVFFSCMIIVMNKKIELK